MSGTIIAIVVVLVILAVLAAIASVVMRRRTAERGLSGPEYDRLAAEMGPRQARAELTRRRRRVDGLGIRALTDERRSAYTAQWEVVQEQFIDNPAEAVSAAEALVVAVAADRGYDASDHEQFVTDLSVYHGRYLDGYRRSVQVTGQANAAATAGQVSTEDERQALLGYRDLFFDLLETTTDGQAADEATADSEVTSGAATSTQFAGQVPAQSPWKQVTQGLHWKTQRHEDSDVTASRR